MHRKHHAFTDEEGDPHSPKMLGFWQVQLGNVFHYVREIKKTDVVERYARDIKDGWWDTLPVQPRPARPRHRHRAALPDPTPVIGLWWTLLGGRHSRGDVRVRAVLVDQRPLPHAGYQNFDNTATNIRALALITGGEGLHNNHHGYPRSPKFSFKAQRDRSRVAAHQAADRAEARQAVQDDPRSRSGVDPRRRRGLASTCCNF